LIKAYHFTKINFLSKYLSKLIFFEQNPVQQPFILSIYPFYENKFYQGPTGKTTEKAKQ